ncbi:MAG TPA: hypothetical protein VMD28_04540 [Acidimicrobiales bacterium]|nr:hypothetical protein [Acidimicrobiales bacterium]
MTRARGPESREKEAHDVRRREIERQLLDLLTPELVEEHRRSPVGRHSPALAQVLAYLRQMPTEGKLAIYSPRAAPLRVLRLSGVQGKPHDDLGPAGAQPDGVAEDVAAHDVFLRRLRALGADRPTEHRPRQTA